MKKHPSHRDIFQTVFEHAPMPMAIISMDGVIEYINQKTIETFGYRPEDIPTMDRLWVQAYPDKTYRQQVMATWTRLIEQAIAEGHEIKRWDYRVTCKDGTVKTVDIFGVPTENKVFVMFDDITERKQAEQTLQKSEENFRSVLKESLDVIYRRDIKRDQYDYMSPAIEKISGFTIGEFCQLPLAEILERIHPDDRPAVQQRVEASMTGKPVSSVCEYRFKVKDGTYRWFADSVRVLTDHAGTPLYHVGVVRNITERKQAEAALRRSEEQLRQAVNIAGLGIFEHDHRTDAVHWSPKMRQIYGVGPEEPVTLSMIMEFYPPEDREWIAAAIRQAHDPAGDGSYVVDCRIIRRDGSVRWLVRRSQTLFEIEAGQRRPTRTLGVVMDITERKQVEDALFRREKEFMTLAENAPDFIMRFDRQFRHIYINKTLAKLRDLQPEQVIGKTHRELGWPADLSAYWEGRLQEVFTTKRETRFEFTPPQRVPACLQARLTPELNGQGEVETVLCIARDISDLKSMEETLRRSERQLTALLNASNEPITLIDTQGKILSLNEAMARRLGKPRDELLGQNIFSFLSKTLAQTRSVLLQGVVQSGKEVCFEDERNGAHFYNCIYPVIDDGGLVTALAIYANDITARKQAERVLQQTNDELEQKVRERTADLQTANQALREGEARFRVIFEQAGVGVAVVDARTRGFIQVNQKYCDIMGYTPEEMLKISFKDITHPDDIAQDLAQVRMLTEGQIRSFSYEKRYYHKSGRMIWALISVTPLWKPDKPPTCWMTIVEDITDRKWMEHQLVEANATLSARATQLRELASALTLAEQRERQRVASVLHDNLQQLLIAARYRIASLEQIPNQPLQTTLAQAGDLIVQSIECSRTLSGELSPPILQTGGLLPALEWLAEWMQDKHGLTVNVTANANIVPDIEGVIVLLFQAIRELLFNVVKHAGVKSVSVDVQQFDHQISIIITDKGSGFDPTRLRRHQDKTTGLGLVSIRDRLQLLGGYMKIESAPGQGSRFTLTVPVRKAALESTAPATLTPEQGVTTQAPDLHGATRKVRVLVADDHSIVRQAFVQLLNGFADIEVVGEVGDGETAVRMAHQLHPDVVTMDVNMGEMNGIKATQIIHDELPQIRVIGLSMFETSELAQAMLDAGAICYLTKSSPAEVLITAIRAASLPESPAS